MSLKHNSTHRKSKIINCACTSFSIHLIVVLTISDHLEWAKDNEHLILLENKINAYLGVIESDDIYEIYPSAIGKKFHIEIAFKFLPNDAANNFLTTVKRILLEAGYDLHYYHLSN